jgi:hypothetical protein
LTLPLSSFMERWLETVNREAVNREAVNREVVDRVAVDRQGGATGPKTLIIG